MYIRDAGKVGMEFQRAQSHPGFIDKQEALWATYLTRQLGASGQNNKSRKDGCRKITVPLNVNLK